MKQCLNSISVLFLIILLTFQISPVSGTEPDITKIGVSVGDIFTYVLNMTDVIEPPFQRVYNSTTKTSFDFIEQSEFNITITNITVVLYKSDYQIGAKFSNRTFSVYDDLIVTPLEFMLFTDWDFYFNNLTAILEDPTIETFIDSYEIINGKEEFKVSFNFTDVGANSYFEARYDKATGMILYLFADIYFDRVRSATILNQKGYVIQEEISSETTSTTTSSSSTTSTSKSSRPSSESVSESTGPSFVFGFELLNSFIGIIAIISVKYIRKAN